MNDTAIVLQAATILLLVFVAVAIALMVDTARSKKCSECPHCQKIAADKKWEQDKQVHLMYHRHTTGIPDCEFCNMEGRR